MYPGATDTQNIAILKVTRLPNQLPTDGFL